MEIRTDGRDGWIEFTRAGVHVLAKGDDHLRDRLTSALAAAGEDTPADALTDELTSGGVRRTPDFAVVDESDLRVLVRGSARALLTGADGTTREVVAPVRAPWVDEDLDEATTSAVLSTGEPEPVVAEPAATPESSPPAAVSPEMAPEMVPSAPVGLGVVASHPQFVDGHLVGARVAPTAPSGGEAVASSDGHGTSTGVLPVTGESPETSETEQPRPPVRLVLPTGEVIELERGVLLGRAPRASAGIGAAGDPHLVRVASLDNEISRNHAEIYPEGSSVIIRDLGSTNGTTVEPSGGVPRRITPGEPQPIEPGTTIRLAGQVAVVLRDE